MPATRGRGAPWTDNRVYQKPKDDKGVSPPEWTNTMWDLFNLMVQPETGGGVTTTPKGGEPARVQAGQAPPAPQAPPTPQLPNFQTPSPMPTVMPGSVGQPPEMMAQPTQTVQAQAFDPLAAFGESFMPSPSVPPMPQPSPFRVPQVPQQAPPPPQQTSSAPAQSGPSIPSPEPNPMMHDAAMVQLMKNLLGV